MGDRKAPTLPPMKHRQTLKPTDIEKATQIIKECRDIHVEWAEWQENNPDWRDEVKPEDPGLPEYHREWIEKYNFVLSVLGDPSLGFIVTGEDEDYIPQGAGPWASSSDLDGGG